MVTACSSSISLSPSFRYFSDREDHSTVVGMRKHPFFWIVFYYVAQTDLQLMIFLSQAGECWDDRNSPPLVEENTKPSVWSPQEEWGTHLMVPISPVKNDKEPTQGRNVYPFLGFLVVTAGVSAIGNNWEEAWGAIQDIQCAGGCPLRPQSHQITGLEMLTSPRLAVLN